MLGVNKEKRAKAKALREFHAALAARPYDYVRVLNARTALTRAHWPKYGEPWTDGEVLALKRAVRSKIGHAKLPKRLSSKMLRELSKRFGRTDNAISCRWQWITFAERTR